MPAQPGRRGCDLIMERSPTNSTLLRGLSEDEKQNFSLLMERLDERFTNQINMLKTQISGRMGLQESGSANREARIKRLENCPCAVHRDPAHTCVVLDTHEKLARIEAKFDAKLSPIKLRIAYMLGGLGLLAFLLDFLARLIPIIWRAHG
jgi:hypothetical protein